MDLRSEGFAGGVRRLVAGVIMSVLLAACGSASPDGGSDRPRTTREAALVAGEPIPVPIDDAVLEFSGAIGATNEGEKLLLDVKTLERMPLVEATIFEPFLHKDVRFEGVLLSDLFRYVGVGAAAHVEMTALDDYQVDFDLSELEADRVLVASRADGRPISIPDGGPTRIVFFDAEDGLGAITDNWIWSVSHMVFEGGR